MSQLKVAGVIGWPVAHSLSPKLHGHWLRQYAVDGAYVPLAVQKEDFSLVVHALQRAGFVGVNVTLPHKEAAFALAHGHDKAAGATRAANLLIFHTDGRIEARNTDVCGFQSSVTEMLGQDALKNKTAIVLGAGGAARAVILALDQLGIRSIRVLNRSRSRAGTLMSELSSHLRASLDVLDEANWTDAAAQAAILVNATSSGLSGEVPFALSLDPLSSGCAVCNLVYRPLETEFLEQARKRGLTIIDGLGMLMHQAAPCFAAFFGRTPAVTSALRRQLEQALRK